MRWSRISSRARLCPRRTASGRSLLATSEPAPPPFWQTLGLTFQTCVRNARTCLMLSAPYALLVGVALAAGRSVSLNVDPTTIAEGELVAVGTAFIAAVGT